MTEPNPKKRKTRSTKNAKNAASTSYGPTQDYVNVPQYLPVVESVELEDTILNQGMLIVSILVKVIHDI